MAMSGRLEQRLEILGRDRTSGAMDLALEAIGLALDWTQAGAPAEDLSRRLAGLHPGIAAVANVARFLERRAQIGPQELAVELERLRGSLAAGNQRIAENLRAIVRPGMAVITLSNSSTVRHGLIELGVESVYVLESLPGGEGKQMAAAIEQGLRDRGASPRVRLVPDAAMGNIVPEADCALAGVDTFDSSGAIFHKAGTLPLALCCRYFGNPFYAAGHTFKHSPEPLGRLPDPSKPAAEQLFDRTPAELITRLVTEEGE